MKSKQQRREEHQVRMEERAQRSAVLTGERVQ